MPQYTRFGHNNNSDSDSDEEPQQTLWENEQAPIVADVHCTADGTSISSSNRHNEAIMVTDSATTSRHNGNALLENSNKTVPLPTTATVSDNTLPIVLMSKAIEDPYKFTYMVFYLLGIATMTPWNFFVTAEDYWKYKFRNTTLNESIPDANIELTPMQRSFICDLTLTASISGTIFLILNAIYGHRVPLKLKMLGTMFIIFAFFILTTVFVEINTDKWQEQFFLITLLTVVFINVSSAVMSGGIFGIAGLFPSEYMTALVSGQALGGILTALAFIMVKSFDVGPKGTAFIYFIIGTVLMLLSILCYVFMSQEPFFQYYVLGGDKYQIVSNDAYNQQNDDDDDDDDNNDDDDEAQLLPRQSIDCFIPLKPVLMDVFGKVYVYAVSILLLFAATLSVYPGITVLMQSENFGSGSVWSDVYYLPVVNYLFFNSGDYFGRLIAGLCMCPRNKHTLLLMTIVRFIFLPLFLCSNSNQHQFLPVLVHSDSTFISLIILFGLSNGYLANMILIMAPRMVMQHEKQLASSIMAASLSCGLAIGSTISMLFVRML